MAKQKQCKFSDAADFKKLFCPKMPEQLTNQAACWITRRDDLPDAEMTDWERALDEEEDEKRRVSKLAYRLWELGDQLTEFKYIFRTHFFRK